MPRARKVADEPTITILSILTIVILPSVLTQPQNNTNNLDSVNEFAFKLLDNVATLKDGNFAICPLPIWAQLAVLSDGASGETYEEITQQLKLPKDPAATKDIFQAVDSVLKSNGVIIKHSSAVFVDGNLNIHEEFCKAANEFKMDVRSVNTSDSDKLANDINNYVCVATEGLIPNFVDSDQLNDLLLMLIDAVYFKANWTVPFDLEATQKTQFNDHHGRAIGSVNMMYQEAPNSLSYLDDIKAEAIELPYGNNKEYSMVILMPYTGISLNRLLKNLSTINPKDLMTRLKGNTLIHLQNVDTYVPRFEVTADVDLFGPLKYMGFNRMFDKDLAEFTGISDIKLYVSKALQKVKLEVTEEGTAAAAATLTGLTFRSGFGRIEVNRPFLYFIKENKSDLVLFAGVYREPSEF